MIKNFTPRLYQETIFATASRKNTLVVLPTGMGKTFIFLMLAAHRLKLYPNSKILFIGPTKPLIDQYMQVFKESFEMPEEKMAVFTGLVSPEKRAELWKRSVVVFSTPQGLENDIITGRINLEEVSLLGVDEAHRAVGNYAYVFVAKQYVEKSRFPRILGLTASPGTELEKISEVLKNLYIEDIEVRTDEDPDVKPYIKEIEIGWVKVNLPPPFLEVRKYLADYLMERMEKLKKWGILHRADLRFVNKTDLLNLQAQLRGRAASGEKDFVMWNAISVLAEIMKVQHGLELLETQGIIALFNYLDKLNQEGFKTKTKAVKNIVKDLNFRSALIKTQRMYEQGIQHPKLIELARLIKKETKDDAKIMVFNQYRDNALDIVRELNKIEGVRAQIFVGQLKKGETGLSQKEQKQILEKFKQGDFNVLVATAVGEEGLDIPKVDLVIFYEPIPSAIRHIQRRGRTGRQEKGRVIVLMAKGTRDEGYRWSAHHKEKRMYRTLSSLKSKLAHVLAEKKGVSLNKFIEEDVKIFADYREKGSGVIKELVNNGVKIQLEKLENADYLLSSRVGVEYKTSEDFVNSLIDGRLLQQVRDLKRNFEKPLLIVEGGDIYSVRNVHENSIRGMLAAIAIDFGVPVLFSRNYQESASLLSIIAKREQTEQKDFQMHGDKRERSLKEWQEYIVSAFPGIGLNAARPLLRKFKTIKNIVNASKDELKEVEKIGEKKAEDLKNLFESEYNPN